MLDPFIDRHVKEAEAQRFRSGGGKLFKDRGGWPCHYLFMLLVAKRSTLHVVCKPCGLPSLCS